MHNSWYLFNLNINATPILLLEMTNILVLFVVDKLCCIVLFVTGCKLYCDVIAVCVFFILSRNIAFEKIGSVGTKPL